MLATLVLLALGACPAPSSQEGALDCPWAAIARAVLPATTPGRVAKRLAAEAPALWTQVGRDAKRARLHAAWGQSSNLDELVHAEIVRAPLLAALGAHLGVLTSGAHVHAGLQHTYGYLLSTLATPFGYKRARWVDGELERGLGLLHGVLGPTPEAGSLYANVTCLLAQVAFSAAERRGLDEECAASAAPSIVRYTPPLHMRLEETVGGVTLRSEWIPLGMTKRFLFIYSVVEGGAPPRLLTSFPVDLTFLDALRDGRSLGEKQPIAVRYNAFVPGLSDSKLPLVGTRRLVSCP